MKDVIYKKDLRILKNLILNGNYEDAVYFARSLGLAANMDIVEGYPNTNYYYSIYLNRGDGIVTTLLDAAYTTGNAGWYRIEGLWVLQKAMKSPKNSKGK